MALPERLNHPGTGFLHKDGAFSKGKRPVPARRMDPAGGGGVTTIIPLF